EAGDSFRMCVGGCIHGTSCNRRERRSKCLFGTKSGPRPRNTNWLAFPRVGKTDFMCVKHIEQLLPACYGNILLMLPPGPGLGEVPGTRCRALSRAKLASIGCPRAITLCGGCL